MKSSSVAGAAQEAWERTHSVARKPAPPLQARLVAPLASGVEPSASKVASRLGLKASYKSVTRFEPGLGCLLLVRNRPPLK